jgi:hypothetical protein
MDGTTELDARVARLERELARWRRGGLGAALLAAGALGLGAMRQDAAAGAPAEQELELLRARRIEILGPDDRPAVVLDADERGFGRVTLHGAGEKPTSMLYRDEAGNGAISVHNAAGALVDYLGADPEGNGGLRIANADGTHIFYVGDDVRGNGVIEASAKGGERVR